MTKDLLTDPNPPLIEAYQCDGKADPPCQSSGFHIGVILVGGHVVDSELGHVFDGEVEETAYFVFVIANAGHVLVDSHTVEKLVLFADGTRQVPDVGSACTPEFAPLLSW